MIVYCFIIENPIFYKYKLLQRQKILIYINFQKMLFAEYFPVKKKADLNCQIIK